MLGTTHLPLFIATGVLLNLTPGQDTFYIIGRSLAQGRRAGVLSALGIATGSLIHTTAAALGFSALLSAFPWAFQTVKILGALYLAFLGVKMFAAREYSTDSADRPQASIKAVFAQAVLTNALNPKVALFFLAFLPQFVDSSQPGKVIPFLFLGALFTFNGTIWCLILACFAAALSARLKRKSELLHRAAGAIFIALGIRLFASK